MTTTSGVIMTTTHQFVRPFDGGPLRIINIGDAESARDERPDPGRRCSARMFAKNDVMEPLNAVVGLGDETAAGRPPSIQITLNRHDGPGPRIRG